MHTISLSPSPLTTDSDQASLWNDHKHAPHYFDIQRRIQDLTADIANTQDHLTCSESKIIKLEGGKASKLFIIGKIIKLFYQIYHRAQILREKHHCQILHQKRLADENAIYLLRKDLEQLNTQICVEEQQSDIQIDQIQENDFLPEDNLNACFQVNQEEGSFLERVTGIAIQKIQKIDDQKIIPIDPSTKQWVEHRPIPITTIQTAAAKGKAAQIGFQAIQTLASQNATLIDKQMTSSAHKVFLLPDQNAVFKLSHPRAEEEERIVSELFDLLSPYAVLSSFNIKQFSLNYLDLKFLPHIQDQGIIIEQISSNFLQKIKPLLSPTDDSILRIHYKKLSQAYSAKKQHQIAKKIEWSVQFPNELTQTLTLSQLQSLYLADQIPSDTMIGNHTQQMNSLEKHILEDTPFFKQLSYFPTLEKSIPLIYLLPDPKTPKQQQTYDRCQQFRWSYLDEKDQRQEVDFKTLQLNYFNGKAMRQMKAVPSANRLTKLPTDLDRDNAFEIHRKILSSELLEFDEIDKKFFKINPIQTKPFMHEMVLLNQLTPRAQSQILSSLTKESEFNIILTGELQLLDLHGGNLGFCPVTNSNYEQFKELSFNIHPFSKTINFKKLIIKYLEGKIQANSVIKIINKHQTIEKAFKDLPELKKALDVQWQLTLFDTDLALAESNNFIKQILELKNGVKKVGHLIPLRSGFLESSWKDVPLNSATIQKLLESQERDSRIFQWINKEDAPIYKRLSKNTKLQLKSLLAPIIQKYEFSQLRESLIARSSISTVTIRTLQKQFVTEFAHPQSVQYHAIWNLIEQDLSTITIGPTENLQTLAIRYKRKEADLQLWNPNSTFQPGDKIYIQDDLHSNDSDQLFKRRSHIAKQLFPRLTQCQQDALIERQRNRQTYLNNYQTLLHSPFKGQELFEQIQTMICQKEFPLDTLRKEHLLSQLQQLNESQSQEILSFRDALCQEIQPTYFNLMKAMYPYLADAYALAEAVKGKDKAGMYIGYFRYDLETLISEAKKKFPHDSKEYQLALILEGEIKSQKDFPLFGKWDGTHLTPR